MRRFVSAAASGLLLASMAAPALASAASSSSSPSSSSSAARVIVSETSSSASSAGSSANEQREILRRTRQNAKLENQERRAGKRQRATVNSVCVKAATAKREASVAKGFADFAADVSEAYAVRAAALDSTWDITDASGRRLGLKSAWSAFQETVMDARETLRTARKDAWKLYNAEVRACGVTSTGEEGGEGIDLGI